MKRTKIIIFSMALTFLLFANIDITLFDGTSDEIKIKLNNDKTFATGFEEPIDEISDGNGCYSSYILECVLGNDQKICDFSGVYGPPYRCTSVDCVNSQTNRRCVRSGS